MPDVSAVTRVAAPAQRVYDRLTDFPRLAPLLDGVDAVEQPRPGRLVLHRRDAARAVRAEVVENVIGARLVWAPAGGEPGESAAFTIDDMGEACRVTLALSGVPAEDRADARGRAERTLARLRDALEESPDGADGATQTG